LVEVATPRPFAVLTPGLDPVKALGLALATLGDPQGERPSLLVIDQLEEAFTLCGDEERRRAFFDRLLAQPPDRTVILTMRADFWGDCAPYKELAAAMLGHQALIPPMDAAELRRAMERQAAA